MSIQLPWMMDFWFCFLSLPAQFVTIRKLKVQKVVEKKKARNIKLLYAHRN